MSIFQCENCGCAENTALGWYHSRDNDRLTVKEQLGKKLCCVCTSQYYPSGEKKDRYNGKWHGQFKRVFLPKNTCFTNGEGNLQHIESGLTGSKLYAAYGSDKEFI